jgi:hypothetical protein
MSEPVDVLRILDQQAGRVEAFELQAGEDQGVHGLRLAVPELYQEADPAMRRFHLFTNWRTGIDQNG